MKSILIALMLISGTIFGQEAGLPINLETKRIEFTNLVKVDSTTSKDELYTQARIWMVSSFKSATNVIQMEDKSSGTIIGKGSISLKKQTATFNGHIAFTIKIQVKEGRYKYWINDLEHFTFSGIQNGGISGVSISQTAGKRRDY